MTPEYIADHLNGRIYTRWSDDGVEYVSNILLYPGASIPLHKHSYDHGARVRGRMTMRVNDGQPREVANEEVFIPAWAQHTFTLIEGINGVGEVLCYWRPE